MSAFRISGEQILYTRNSNFWVPLLCIILNTWSRVRLLNEKHVLHYGFGFEKKKFNWYMFVFQQTTSIFFRLKEGLPCTSNLAVLHSFFKNLCLNQLLTMFAKPFSTQCRYYEKSQYSNFCNLMIFILRIYPRVIWGHDYVAFGNSRRFLSLTLTTNTWVETKFPGWKMPYLMAANTYLLSC